MGDEFGGAATRSRRGCHVVSGRGNNGETVSKPSPSPSAKPAADKKAPDIHHFETFGGRQE